MMVLKEILYKAGIRDVLGSTDVVITSMTFDSRHAETYGLFVAIRGEKSDGHDYIAQAIENGAAAIVCETFPDEIRKEITDLATDRPATADEVALVKRSNTLSLPGQWETGSAVLGSISKLVEFGLPDNYWATYADAVRSLTPEQVNQAARDYLQPGNLVFVVVGDRAAIEPGLGKLGFDSIQLVDTDGDLL